MSASRAAQKKRVTILADGGITKSGDIVKALTLAHAVICGGMLAGCPEAPGRGDGDRRQALQAIPRHGQPGGDESRVRPRATATRTDPTRKVAPEGVEALKEVSGSVDRVLAQLIGGIQSGMGYLGAANLAQLREKARFIRVSPAGQREAAPHDVVELKTGKLIQSDRPLPLELDRLVHLTALGAARAVHVRVVGVNVAARGSGRCDPAWRRARSCRRRSSE